MFCPSVNQPFLAVPDCTETRQPATSLLGETFRGNRQAPIATGLTAVLGIKAKKGRRGELSREEGNGREEKTVEKGTGSGIRPGGAR